MSTYDYVKSRNTAERLIKRFGKSATLRRKTNADNANTPWDPSDDIITIGDYPCIVCVTDYNALERNNSMIGMSDKKVLVSTEGLSVQPLSSDTLVIDGDEHEIISLRTLQPAETAIMHEAQVRF